MARRRAARQPPTTPAVGADVGPGSRRARMRLAPVLLLGLLALAYLALGVRVYFFPTGATVASALVGAAFGAAALVYGLLARAVAKQSRIGHLVAAVVCVVGALLSINAGMAWPDWVVLVVNAVAFCLLLGSVPGKASAS